MLLAASSIVEGVQATRANALGGFVPDYLSSRVWKTDTPDRVEAGNRLQAVAGRLLHFSGHAPLTAPRRAVRTRSGPRATLLRPVSARHSLVPSVRSRYSSSVLLLSPPATMKFRHAL